MLIDILNFIDSYIVAIIAVFVIVSFIINKNNPDCCCNCGVKNA